jgi:hypothetical protein
MRRCKHVLVCPNNVSLGLTCQSKRVLKLVRRRGTAPTSRSDGAGGGCIGDGEDIRKMYLPLRQEPPAQFTMQVPTGRLQKHLVPQSDPSKHARPAQLGSLSCACALSWPNEKTELTTSRVSKKSSSIFLRILTMSFLLF